jgi:hypothetical protein
MTPAQALALAHPCFLAGQTVHPRYGYRQGRCSVMLTVNAGWE